MLKQEAYPHKESVMMQTQTQTIDTQTTDSTDDTEYADEIPNAQTIAAMEEWSEMMANPKKYKRYKSFADVMRDVLGKQIDNDK